jgi:tetratricopeptide (TPR) repeat protein
MLISIKNALFIFCTIILTLSAHFLYAQNIEQVKLANEYYKQGEIDKAADIYAELAKDDQNIRLIHENYFDLMLNSGSFKEAEKYLNKIIKRFPENFYYAIDKGVLYHRQNNESAAKKIFAKVIDEVKQDAYKLRMAAQYWVNHQLSEIALEAYLQGRKAKNDPYAYAIELANVYRLTNNVNRMVEEYLVFAEQNPSNLNYVKNILQNYLNSDEDLENLENLLLSKVQKHPDQHIYNELLIWVNLQQKNFYGAFIQARALDKRQKAQGSKLMDIGIIALENKDYENAIHIFEYVVKENQGTVNYVMARRYVIKAREEFIKTNYPVDKNQIVQLIKEYNDFIKESGVNQSTMEARRSKAQLFAFYLDEKDSAIYNLKQIIETPRADPNLKANAKLDLGDIYLLMDEPWESTLLYSQVEKSHKEHPLGYEAKLRNAKLSYYSGNFELAKSHLDVLKLATTREIANDAMALSVFIQDNIAFDSTGKAMKRYAEIELMLFQNKKTEAIQALDQMLKDFSDHSLVDDILWLKANILFELGKWEEALVPLEKISSRYAEDVLGDDALFLTGRIYEEKLKNKAKAMDIYQQFLKAYPGSVYVAEARKRFRVLRGDNL